MSLLFKAMVSQDYRYLLCMLIGVIPCMLLVTLYGVTTSQYAFRLGDPTPKCNGGHSHHPLHHVDPVGMLLLVTTGIGWGRWLPMHPTNFKKPFFDMIKITVMGSLSGFCVSVVMLLCSGVLYQKMEEQPTYVLLYLTLFCIYVAVVSFSFALFQWLPLPFLGGFRCFMCYLPKSMTEVVEKYMHYVTILWIVTLWAGLWNPILFPMVACCLSPLCDMVKIPFSVVSYYFL